MLPRLAGPCPPDPAPTSGVSPASSGAGSARLTELLRLRDQLDTEIRRERAFLARFAPIASQFEDLVDLSPRDANLALAAVARVLDVPVEDLTGPRRAPRLVVRRHIAAWVLRQDGFSLPEIGRAIGRDHTTVAYSIQRVERDPDLRSVAAQARAALEAA